MNPRDHVAEMRHHLTVVTTSSEWNVDTMAQFIRDVVDQNDASDEIVSVEPFDENHELVEMRSTLDKAFRVIGTGAIKMLEDGDGWECFRALLAALRAFIEVGENFKSSARNPEYSSGEEDGHAVALQQLEKIIEMCERK